MEREEHTSQLVISANKVERKLRFLDENASHTNKRRALRTNHCNHDEEKEEAIPIKQNKTNLQKCTHGNQLSEGAARENDRH